MEEIDLIRKKIIMDLVSKSFFGVRQVDSGRNLVRCQLESIRMSTSTNSNSISLSFATCTQPIHDQIESADFLQFSAFQYNCDALCGLDYRRTKLEQKLASRVKKQLKLFFTLSSTDDGCRYARMIPSSPIFF